MLIESENAIFDVPEEMIRKYVLEFSQFKKDYDHRALINMRESVLVLIEAMNAINEAIDNPAVINGAIKAYAMREAMKKLGILYDD